MYDLSLFCFSYSKTRRQWHRNPHPHHVSVPQGLGLTIASCMSTILIVFLKKFPQKWIKLKRLILYIFVNTHYIFLLLQPFLIKCTLRIG